MISFSEENKNDLKDKRGFRSSKCFIGFSRQYSLSTDLNRIMEKKISDYAKNLIKKLNDIKKNDNDHEKQKNNHNKNINLPPVTLVPFEISNDTYKILDYIFGKKGKKKNDILYIQHFLTLYDSLIKNLFKTKLLTNPNILLNQLAKFIRIQRLAPSQLLFRYGDRGDYFYFIFQGKVIILIPREIKVEITESQYLEHLKKLADLKEYGLILKIIETNINIFNSFDVKEYKNLAFDMINNKKSIMHKTSIKRYESIKNIGGGRQSIFQKPPGEIFLIDEYINSIEPKFETKQININNKKLSEVKEEKDFLIGRKYNHLNNRSSYDLLSVKVKQPITLFGYYQVATLEEFNTFGDVALAASSSNRTATIISNGKTVLGQIENKIYSKCIKTCMDLVRYKNVSKLINIPIFQDVEIEIFNEKYFNYFELINFKRGDVIFKQKDERKSVFFIKEGEIELSMKGSIIDINKIIQEFSPDDLNCRNKLLKNGKYKDDILSNYYNKDKEINNWRILSQFPCDVFGLDDCLYKDHYFVTATSKTAILQLYEIDIKVFNVMINSVMIYKNYTTYIKFKKNQMLERLKHIRETFINQKYKERENAITFYPTKTKSSFSNESYLNVDLLKQKFQERNSLLNNISDLSEKNSLRKISNINESYRINLKKNNITPLALSPLNNKLKTHNNSLIYSANLTKNYFSSRQTQISTSRTVNKKTKHKIIFNLKQIKRNKYSSSLCNYIKNVKEIKLTEPKMNAFSELMFELSTPNSKKNYSDDDEFDNNYQKKKDNVNDIDILAFDNIMQNKIHSPIFNITKKKFNIKKFKDKGFKGFKISIKKNILLTQK